LLGRASFAIGSNSSSFGIDAAYTCLPGWVSWDKRGSMKTTSELEFEKFLTENGLPFERVEE
jgi:hypothetical protein